MADTGIEKFKYIRRVTPYVPGDQPEHFRVKLNTNENPYPPAPGVAKVLAESDSHRLRLYPDPLCKELVDAIAGYHGVDPARVFVGIGSDDVLALSFMTFFNGEKPLLFPDITYSFYEVWASLFGIHAKKIPLDEQFCIRPDDYAKPCCGVIFPNPNAPTGILSPLSTTRRIAGLHPECVVIVDEAYIDFGGESALSLLPEYDNLMIVRTFSKSRSLAGLRVGYAVGDKRLIDALWSVRSSFNSYTLTETAVQAAVASIRDETYFRERIGQIVATRERTKTVLADMGYDVLPSEANFVFAGVRDGSAKRLAGFLKERGIFVRYFPGERTGNRLRITIGTEPQMDELFAALKEYHV